MGRPLAGLLRQLRAPTAPRIHDLRDLGFSGVADEIWMPELAKLGIRAVVTCDSRILRAPIRRGVWRAASLTLFVLESKWADLRLFDQARGLLWWWPFIVTQAEAGPQGAAWHVPVTMHASGMRRLFEEPPATTA